MREMMRLWLLNLSHLSCRALAAVLETMLVLMETSLWKCSRARRGISKLVPRCAEVNSTFSLALSWLARRLSLPSGWLTRLLGHGLPRGLKPLSDGPNLSSPLWITHTGTTQYQCHLVFGRYPLENPYTPCFRPGFPSSVVSPEYPRIRFCIQRDLRAACLARRSIGRLFEYLKGDTRCERPKDVGRHCSSAA